MGVLKKAEIEERQSRWRSALPLLLPAVASMPKRGKRSLNDEGMEHGLWVLRDMKRCTCGIFDLVRRVIKEDSNVNTLDFTAFNLKVTFIHVVFESDERYAASNPLFLRP